MNPLLNIGIKAARAGGNVIIRYIDRLEGLRIETKGRNDFVSEVDRMAEQAIIEVIQKGYPDHAILAEESGGQYSPQTPTDTTWIIDPLDGTTNFLHGHPDFCISIAVQSKNTIEHGVIYDPLRNEIFTASRGQGAQLNGRRIHVSGQTHLSSSLITVGYPNREIQQFENWRKCFNSLLPKVLSIRHTGSAALDLAYVASARTDAFFEPLLKPWDLAAGSLIVREAKGLVADFDGQHDFLESGNIVCANPHIFNELLKLIQFYYRD